MLTGQIKKIIRIIDEIEMNLVKTNSGLQDINGITESTNIYVNFDCVIEKILKHLSEIYGFENYLLIMVSPDQNLYRIEKYRIADEIMDSFSHLWGRFYSLSISSGKIAECIILNEILFLKNLDIPSLISNKSSKLKENLVLRSVLLLPINIGNRMIGSVVLLNHRNEMRLKDEDKELIKQLINYIALPLKTDFF